MKQDPNNVPVKTILSEEKLCSWIIKKSRSVYVPASLYRIQLSRLFTFKDATALVPYWKELGIDAVYCSPYFQAVPESLHGYNVADPNSINTEIGSEEDYQAFCQVLSAHGMGHIVDVVPNHMGISANNNIWWMDVLENGQSSPYAPYFDIEWASAKSELKGKVLLPVLGDLFGRVLENQELCLRFEEGSFSVYYYDRRLPVDPQTYPMILEYGLEELEALLGKDSADILEYLSIVTAFRNLPSHGESSSEKIAERCREKEIAKARLGVLARRSLNIQTFIEGRVGIFNGKKGDPRSFDLLEGLLNQQAYRLSLWSVASQEINYRRFFNINDLAAIHIENEKVFLHYHQRTFSLIREGKISGLRIDHPDGLYDPPAYFRALQRECFLQMILKEWDESVRQSDVPLDPIDLDNARATLDRLLVSEFASSPGFFVVVEKILDRNEHLPLDWNIHGTVGYDFLNALNGLFVDSENGEAFSRLYEEYIGQKIDFEELVYAKKKFFALVHMASEINALGYRLDQISETNRLFRDFTRNDLTLAIREVIACFPVYRTYVTPEATVPSEKDIQYITRAVDRAKKRTPALNASVYDFLRDVLLLRVSHDVSGEEGRLYRDFLLRFQQLTGPIMAKGVEDTSFYVYNRLISLNEVGGDPFHFGNSVDHFHGQNIDRSKRWPCSLLAGSTHDTKRSEDVRMRINVLSEDPQGWQTKITEWSRLNEAHKQENGGVLEPRRNTEYYLYQTLIGAWPDRPLGTDDFPGFLDRIWEVLLKSIREAKVYTNWISPDLEYEGAVRAFLFKILEPGPKNVFLQDFLEFQRTIAFYGRLNSISAVLLKCASPGVVDTYQGDEFLNYCLVDPDNRYPVDYGCRKDVLLSLNDEIRSGKHISFLLAQWQKDDPSRVKMFILSSLLRYRKAEAPLFVGGEYHTAFPEGERARHIVSFVRRRGEKIVLAVAARLFRDLLSPGEGLTPPKETWDNTIIRLPGAIDYPAVLKDILTGNKVAVRQDQKKHFVSAADIFSCFPVALLERYEE